MRSRITAALAILIVCASIAVVGCASGPIAPPPRLTEPGAAVTITLHRKSSIVGFPATMFFIINGQRIYGLRNNQKWSFNIDPGEYQIGYDLGFNSCRQRVIFKPNRRYLVELTPICVIKPTAM
ncbi:MAG: hypothetical protein N838_23005 [Thiohalocapsa sp. PB-PSB1]|jgi:hypothetical protein|nr:MAG: hypothetical protein N838_33535 [Thiohalocapsa sp. PB-PSB1]QQO55790.1 MAG: hypothetical protein N838_23005 [Thiohalocapsa sp. PB-PSB1]HCS88947.1 hypothetical protein [Chromatiaceae bacterium]